MNLPFMVAGSESGGHPSHYDLPHQRHVVISTCGFTAIYCGQGELFSVPELKARTDEYLKLAHQAGAEFASGNISILTKTPAPKQGTLEYLFKDYDGGSFQTELIDLGETVGNEQW